MEFISKLQDNISDQFKTESLSAGVGFQYHGQSYSITAVAANERLWNIKILWRTLGYIPVPKYKWHCKKSERLSIFLFQKLKMNQGFTIDHKKK